MNNKGFAISTVIYGLSILGMMLLLIMMSVIASNRTNNTKLVETIESELVGFGKSEITFSTKVEGGLPVAQEYIVPDGESGWYRIELWGAAGGKSGSNYNGGKGAYTSGIVELKEGDTLYFYVGNSTSNGGRETDVRYVGGSYTDNTGGTNDKRIMVAAGGGQNAYANGGTLEGYTPDMLPHVGRLDLNRDYELKESEYSTLVGYKKGIDISTASSVKTTPGSPGSGNHILVKGDVYDEVAESNVEQVLHDFYFVDTLMFEGVNSGEGKAKIERLIEKNESVTALPKKNSILSSPVSSIKDCVSGTLPSGWTASSTKIVAFSKGIDVGGTKSVSGNCVTLDLGGNKDLDEIAVWHKSGYDFMDNTVEVFSNGTWKYIKNKGTNTSLSETETPYGFHYSAYQIDSTATVPDKGNYFIVPVLTENRALSAPLNSSDDTKVTADYFQGLESQKWSIEKLTDPKVTAGGSAPEYKIVELLHNKALSILQDDNISLNDISAGSSFNTSARNDPQIWKITAVGNGTYTITSSLPSVDSSENTGNIFPKRGNNESDNVKPGFVIGKNNTTTQRFKIVSIDYSN